MNHMGCKYIFKNSTINQVNLKPYCNILWISFDAYCIRHEKKLLLQVIQQTCIVDSYYFGLQASQFTFTVAQLAGFIAAQLVNLAFRIARIPVWVLVYQLVCRPIRSFCMSKLTNQLYVLKQDSNIASFLGYFSLQSIFLAGQLTDCYCPLAK